MCVRCNSSMDTCTHLLSVVSVFSGLSQPVNVVLMYVHVYPYDCLIV